MVQKNLSFFLLMSLLVVGISPIFVSAWEFNGTVRNIDGVALNHTLVNITIWSMSPESPPSIVGSNSTYSYPNGSFSINVSENSSWSYKPVITHTNLTTGAIDWIGQSLPDFPYFDFVNTQGINFYLREAGTINITAMNATGSPINFQYVVKDSALGYTVAENFPSYVSQATIYVPRDRNYSIMIYPNESLPVSYDWNNFSSEEDYEFNYSSSYNATTHQLDKRLYCTEEYI